MSFPHLHPVQTMAVPVRIRWLVTTFTVALLLGALTLLASQLIEGQKPPVVQVPPPVMEPPPVMPGAPEAEVALPEEPLLPPLPPFTNSLGMEMVSLAGGEFTMGSPRNEIGHRSPRETQRRVRVPRRLHMSACEVTQRQYEAITGANPSRFKHLDQPVERVTWEEALRFCRLLSEKEGRAYRLPTSVEWEYACRAGTTTPFHFGGALPAAKANFNPRLQSYGLADNGPYRGRPVAVGSFPPNAWGLHDMHGNVAEWCMDLYPGPGDFHNLAGGSWESAAVSCRSAARIGWGSESNATTGFRVVCPDQPADQWWLEPAPGADSVARLVARIDEAFAKPRVPLRPGVLIFPVMLDQEAEPKQYPTPEGLAASQAAMLAANYGPRRRLNASYRTVAEAVLRTRAAMPVPDIDQHGKLDQELIERCLAEANLTLYALPKIRSQGRKRELVVELHGDGKEYGDRTFTHPFDITTMPGLIACDVLEYLGVPLSPAERERALRSQLTQRDGYEITQLAKGWEDRDEKRAQDVLRPLTQVPVAWDVYLQFTHDQAAAYEALETRGRGATEACDELKMARAAGLRENGRLRQALDLLLEMAPTQRGEPEYHMQLALCGVRLGEPTVVEHLLKVWEREDPGYSGLVGRGKFLCEWGQSARGSQWAHLVTEEAFKLYGERLSRARKQFEAAAAANPRAAYPHVRLIDLARGLALPREFVEEHFAAARKKNPNSPAPYFPKFSYLQPRWHGTPSELLKFGAECATTGRWQSGVQGLFAAAIYDVAFDFEQSVHRREAFRLPGVWEGTKAYFERSKDAWITEPEATFNDRVCSQFLLWGSLAGYEAELAPALERIVYPDLEVISDYVTYHHIRDRVEALTSKDEATKLRAQVRVALASGDQKRAEESLAVKGLQAADAARYGKALGFARALAKEGKVILTPRDILDSWTIHGKGAWTVEGDELVCRLKRSESATIVCPFPFGPAEVTGTFQASEQARVAQLVTHAQSEMDTVHLRFEPQTSEVGVTRNARRMAADHLGAGRQSFRVALLAEGDEFQLGEGPKMQVSGQEFRPGGIGFELYSFTADAEIRIGQVEIRLRGR